MAKVLVLGAGMMGSAFTVPLVDRGHEAHLVGTHLDEHIVTTLQTTRLHPTLHAEIPKAVAVHPLAELPNVAREFDACVLGVSSAGVRWAAETLAPFLRHGTLLLMLSKGLAWENGELRVLSEVFREGIPEPVAETLDPIAVAGPCIAGELARRVPTSVVFTAKNSATRERAGELANTGYYHVWTSADVVGVQLCAALKNAYAMAVAFADGLHESRGGTVGSVAMHNYQASVFAQAITEMRRLVELAGGNPESVTWLPGVGDLDVTCSGGRTGRLGRLLGAGVPLPEAVERMQGATLEALEVLALLDPALQSFTEGGKLGAMELPLLRHLTDIALRGARVQVPFFRFFGAPSPETPR